MTQHRMIDDTDVVQLNIDEIDSPCEPGLPNVEKELMKGILVPALSYRWRLRFENDQENLLTQQVRDLEIDYVNKEIRMNIVEPAAHNGVQQYMLDNAGKNVHVYIEIMTGSKKKEPVVGQRLEFETKFSGHKFRLDYGKDEPALHEITLSII